MSTERWPVSGQSKHEGSPLIRPISRIKRRRLASLESEAHVHCLSLHQISSRDEYLPSPSGRNVKLSSVRQVRNRKRRSSRSKKRTKDGYRKWVFSSHDCSRYKDKVVVVSYNILGVENVLKHPDLYPQVPPQFLNWEWRKKLIRKELNHYMPSIVCLQEVDRFNDLSDLLQKDGFRGVYKARTGEACDGCALFWKEELFTLLHEENIEFQKFGLRDNVAQLCVLKMNNHCSSSHHGSEAQASETSPARSLLVGNIHMLFNPNRGDIKLGQIRLFLDNAHRISQEWGNIPVVIAGDLNSIPQSAIYRFLDSSELDILLHDRRKISGQVEYPIGLKHFKTQREDSYRPLRYRWSQEEIRLATGCDGITHLRHHLKLSSVYRGVAGSCRTRDSNEEPLATSYHSKFMGTVDYIWHSRELIPVGVIETLPVNILRETGGLPSEITAIGLD
ncbi:PREDICTED: carbon catabolite repressor protein 4 homolog 5 isoform X2 [Nelumbo nucifera]|uniref:Carbon catabolite repressor protein 4 homolog 5 isoform X2 n=1 Tax=Nelumbo nucifera TaxID=4432 RepID=A0A1U8A8H1_NELNU|nr:PREDICTED: carbon catabolite repressor protein 4 homolog 5 isoform X2 [Nelumbo nucifera]